MLSDFRLLSTANYLKNILSYVNKNQVTYPHAAFQERRVSDIIGQPEVHIINLSKLGSLEDEPKLIPFNNLEELPDRRLYQVPRRKEQEDDEAEFFIIILDKNYSLSSSSKTDKSSHLSDTDSELIKVVTAIVTKITKGKSRKKQEIEH